MSLTADLTVGLCLPARKDDRPALLASSTVAMFDGWAAAGGRATSCVPSETAAKRQPLHGSSLATTLPASDSRVNAWVAQRKRCELERKLEFLG